MRKDHLQDGKGSSCKPSGSRLYTKHCWASLKGIKTNAIFIGAWSISFIVNKDGNLSSKGLMRVIDQVLPMKMS